MLNKMVCQILQVRVVNGTPPTGDYSFAKYNKVNSWMLPSPFSYQIYRIDHRESVMK